MSNHIIHEIGDVFVSNRAARAVLLAVAIAATGAGVFALSHGAVAASRAEAATPDAGALAYGAAITVLPTVIVQADADMPVLLPTVVVHADAAIPTLPTVTVRASRIERAGSEDGAEPVLVAVEQDSHTLATGVSAGAGYDMPYYSFGKTLRRLNKE